MRTILLILALSISTQAAALTVSGCVDGYFFGTWIEVRQKDSKQIKFLDSNACFSAIVSPQSDVYIAPHSLMAFQPESVIVRAGTENVMGINFTGYRPYRQWWRF